MYRLIKLISLVILIVMPSTYSYADEVLWGTSTATGTATGFVGGVRNWPSFSAIGGTGVSDTPYRAMIVDTNFMWTRFTGAGLDADGSMYGVTGISNPSCTYGSAGFAVNAFDDHPCASSLAGNSFDINVNSGALPTSIGLDHNDPDLKYLCRDSNTLEHEVGTDFDVPISVNETNAYPVVMRDDSEGKYRIILGNTSGMDCVDPSVNSNMNVNLELMYSPTTADDLQLFMADKVHIDQYASRLLSQTILDFSWEDINPEMLGVVNLIPNGSFEDTCTGTGALGTPFVRSGAATLVSRTQPVAGSAFHGPILGLGCEWSVASWVVPDTLTTPTITASPGEFYVGSTFFSTNGIDANDRSSFIRIRDNAGNNISNVKFWIAGPTAGTIAEDADIIDGSGTVTAGEYSPPERACYGGCFIKFAFQVESGDTGFDIQIARSQNIKMYFDELWVRKKMFNNFDRNPLIADGRARIQLLSDSRGTLAYSRLPVGLDYMTGFTTKNGNTRSPYRPGLTLDVQPSLNTWTVSGAALGSYVGQNDGSLRYNGDPIPEYLGDAMDKTANYCIGFFGVNDMTQGGRPTTALNAGLVGQEYRFFGDQIRGFEIAAQSAGCLPILLMDSKHMGNTARQCRNDAGGTQNCALWFNQAWETIMHNGIK